MSGRLHRAPWSRALVATSGLTTALLLGVALVGTLTGPRHEVLWRIAMVWTSLAVLAGGLLFVVRGYRLEGRRLEIPRLLWTTRWELEALRDATVDPEAFRGAIRLMGNGGLFSFSGWFRSRRLGRFRALVTDLRRSVVLRTGERVLVVSPEDPEAFVEELRSAFHLSGGAGS